MRRPPSIVQYAIVISSCTTNMRDLLIPLHGKCVQYYGTLKEWRTHNDTVDLCYVNVEVCEHNPNLSLQHTPRINIDHIWLSWDIEHTTGMDRSLLTKRSGLGYVYQYERNNGSLDFSVKSTDAIFLDKVIDQINRKKKLIHHFNPKGIDAKKKMLEYLTPVVDRLTAKSMKYYYRGTQLKSANQAIEEIIKYKEILKTDVSLFMCRNSRKKSFGKPKGIRLHKSKPPMKVAVGFV